MEKKELIEKVSNIPDDAVIVFKDDRGCWLIQSLTYSEQGHARVFNPDKKYDGKIVILSCEEKL